MIHKTSELEILKKLWVYSFPIADPNRPDDGFLGEYVNLSEGTTDEFERACEYLMLWRRFQVSKTPIGFSIIGETVIFQPVFGEEKARLALKLILKKEEIDL